MSCRARPESRDPEVSLHPVHNDLPRFLNEKKPPSFNIKLISPPRYIDALKEYFNLQNIYSDKSKLACAKYGLKRRYENWFDIHGDKIENFIDFENCFIDDMWSEKDQLAYKSTIFAEEFRSIKKDESLVDFFERNYSKVVNHFPLMSFEELKIKFSAQIPQIQNFYVIIANTSSYDSFKDQLKCLDYCKIAEKCCKFSTSSSNYCFQMEFNNKQNNGNRNRISYANYNQSECYLNNNRGRNRYIPYHQLNKQRQNNHKQCERGIFHFEENSPDTSIQSCHYYQKRQLCKGGGPRHQWNRSNKRGLDSRKEVSDLASNFEEKLTVKSEF